MNENKENLGQKLSEAGADKTKITIHTICRIIIVLLVCFAGVRGFSGLKLWFSSLKGILIFMTIFIPSLIWALYPLVHLQDRLKFYENGLSLNGHIYFHKEIGTISFYDYSYGIKNEQYMKGKFHIFNVTYIVRPKKAYNDAYLNHNGKERRILNG